MKYLAMIVLCWTVTTIQSQHSCCSGSSANLAIGSDAGAAILSKGDVVLQANYMNWSFHSMADRMSLANPISDIHSVQMFSATVLYGLTNKLSIGASLPLMNVSSDAYGYDSDFNLEVDPKSATGLGDASLIGIWNLGLKNMNVGLIAGMEFPTGQVDREGAVLSSSFGSESFDPILGLFAENTWNDVNLRLNSTYKVTTENSNDFDFGDFAMVNLQGSYSFKNSQNCDSDSAQFWADLCSMKAFVGSNFEWMQAQRSLGTDLMNSGSTRIFAQVGLALGVKKIGNLRLWTELPVMEQLSGFQNESQYRIRMALSIKV